MDPETKRRTGFFRHLNTLPSLLGYARQDQFMLNGTPEGLHFLKALCQYH